MIQAAVREHLINAIAIIERADQRAMASDGPALATRIEMTDDEMRELYADLQLAAAACDESPAGEYTEGELLRHLLYVSDLGRLEHNSGICQKCKELAGRAAREQVNAEAAGAERI